jgi:hypothetical protein
MSDSGAEKEPQANDTQEQQQQQQEQQPQQRQPSVIEQIFSIFVRFMVVYYAIKWFKGKLESRAQS